MASLTETTMMSPTEAYFRLLPPRTLMQRTLRAPLLSATSRTLSTWIIRVSLGRRATRCCRAPPGPSSASGRTAAASRRCAPGRRRDSGWSRRAPCSARGACGTCGSAGGARGAPRARPPSCPSCRTPPPRCAPCAGTSSSGVSSHASGACRALAQQRLDAGERSPGVAHLHGVRQLRGGALQAEMEHLADQLPLAVAQLVDAQLLQLPQLHDAPPA